MVSSHPIFIYIYIYICANRKSAEPVLTFRASPAYPQLLAKVSSLQEENAGLSQVPRTARHSSGRGPGRHSDAAPIRPPVLFIVPEHLFNSALHPAPLIPLIPSSIRPFPLSSAFPPLAAILSPPPHARPSHARIACTTSLAQVPRTASNLDRFCAVWIVSAQPGWMCSGFAGRGRLRCPLSWPPTRGFLLTPYRAAGHGCGGPGGEADPHAGASPCRPMMDI